MFSSAPIRLRSALLVFGIGLGLSGLWILFPELLRPKPVGLPFDRNGDEAAAARRTSAVLATEIEVIRGDLWAEAAFPGACFKGTDRSTESRSDQLRHLARARANAEMALLNSWHLESAAPSSVLADKDLQAFIKSDIRGIG